MGCDIHAYIEYYEETSPGPHAICFASDVELGRCYMLFARMAGVRGSTAPVVQPRGVPAPPEPGYSYQVTKKYYALVLEDEQYNLLDAAKHKLMMPWNSFGIPPVARSAAEEMCKKLGFSYKDDKKNLIPAPNWHTPSWLTLNEVLEVRKKYLLDSLEFVDSIRGQRRRVISNQLEDSSASELMSHHFGVLEHNALNATIASMIILERKTNFKSRLVFWFDS